MLASEAERRNVPDKVEVLRDDELLEYYQDHELEWQKPGGLVGEN